MLYNINVVTLMLQVSEYSASSAVNICGNVFESCIDRSHTAYTFQLNSQEV